MQRGKIGKAGFQAAALDSDARGGLTGKVTSEERV